MYGRREGPSGDGRGTRGGSHAQSSRQAQHGALTFVSTNEFLHCFDKQDVNVNDSSTAGASADGFIHKLRHRLTLHSRARWVYSVKADFRSRTFSVQGNSVSQGLRRQTEDLEGSSDAAFVFRPVLTERFEKGFEMESSAKEVPMNILRLMTKRSQSLVS